MSNPTAVSSPATAMWFLYTRTAVNRLRSQIKRARNPRYLIAVLLGALYLWWALFRNTRMSGGALNSAVKTETILPVFCAFLLIAAARWWIFGSERGTLAFAPAEVQFLFPAPVSRRALIHAKLVRTQVAILLNTIIFSVLLRGDSASAQGWRRGFALWIGFSVLALHRLGASIVRANALEHERPGQRRSVVPIVIFSALLGAVAWGLISQFEAIRTASTQGAAAVGRAIVFALQQPIPLAALWPVRAVIAPVFALNAHDWLVALPFAIGMLLVHYLWVVRLDASFEEAALEATQHRAERMLRVRSSQLGKTRSRKGKLVRIPKLPVMGPPAVAIAWKNVAAAMRGGAWRTQLVSFTLGLVVMAVLIRTASEDAADIFLGVVVGWGAMLVFVGPLWMRFDLRLDLPRLAILKTWPLPGKQIVAAEIAAVTVLHSVTIWALMLVPLVLVVMDPSLLTSRIAAPAFVAAAVGIPLLNALMFTVQNGTALMFPAWVKLGTEARGFETMGQNLLTMGATTLVAAVALVFPVGLGLLTIFLGNDLLGSWAYPLAVVLGGILLMLELWPMIHWLGDVFDRTDVNEIGSTA